VCGGNGEIKVVLRLADLMTASGCVGKGKEKGKVYCPEANRPTILVVPFESVLPDWSGSPIDLSQRVNSRFKNGRDPPE
jgi:hypothetical protein